MAKPVSRILVINDENLVLREFVKSLNAAARSLHEGYQPCVRALRPGEARGLHRIG